MSQPVAEEPAPPTASQGHSDAATAGRGFLVISAAKLWFMVGGAAIVFGLPYLIGDPSAYGQYYDITNTMTLFSMVMVTGVMQSVSKFVSESPQRTADLQHQALILMLAVSAVLGGGFIAAAPWTAAYRGNPELAWGYRFAGAILFCYGLYSVFIGVLNGRKQFVRQATFDVVFTTLKACLVLGFAAAGFGVVGAYGGFAAAAVLITIGAAWRVGGNAGERTGWRESRLYGFAFQIMFYTLVFNLIYKLDVIRMKPLATEILVAAGNQDPIHAVDQLIGWYGLAVSLSRLPWTATLAITFVVFPMVSEAAFADDADRTRTYIHQTLRYSLILITAAAIVLTGLPEGIVKVSPPEYAPAARALVWLAPAYICFSLFSIVNTILASSGRASTTVAIGIATATVGYGLYSVLVPMAATPIEILTQTSIATLIAFAVGLVLALASLWRVYGAPIPLGTAVRVLGAAVACTAIARALPRGGIILTLVEAAGIGMLYLIALVAAREFGPEDRARVLAVLQRRRKA